MNLERWRHIDAIYHAALGRPAAERAPFLDHACRGDERLRREVDSLLHREVSAHRFMETPAMDVGRSSWATVRP